MSNKLRLSTLGISLPLLILLILPVRAWAQAPAGIPAGTLEPEPLVPNAMGMPQPYNDLPYPYPVRIVSTAPLADSRDMEAPSSGPALELFYGNRLEFGVLGNPTEDVNIAGRVTGSDRIVELTYRLNQDAVRRLSIGGEPDVGYDVDPAETAPPNPRLVDPGDFNIEIPLSELLAGENRVQIRAEDEQGASVTEEVTLVYTAGQVWPRNYAVGWDTTTDLTAAAQIVDGRWQISGDRLVPVQVGYDRLLAIGDLGWTNYEVSVPITVRGIDDAGFASPSNGPGIGVMVRWRGHIDDPGHPGYEQPKRGWRRLGALGWYRWSRARVDGEIQYSAAFNLIGGTGAPIGDDVTNKQMPMDVPHMFKLRVETVASAAECDPDRPSSSRRTCYRFKVWPIGDPEPADWDLVGLGNNGEPESGSLLLVAHHVQAEFGDAALVPLGDPPRFPVTELPTDHGLVEFTPQQSDYALDETMTATALPDPGYRLAGWWVDFGNWTGSLPATGPQLRFDVGAATTLEATFAPTAYALDLAVDSQGNGVGGEILATPDGPSYAYDEAVTLEALPANGWVFEGWSGDLTGNDTPATIRMTSDRTVRAQFRQLHELTATTVGGGSINLTPEKDAYLHEEQIQLEAVPVAGWIFRNWSDNVADPSAVQTSIRLKRDETVTAIFAALRSVTVTGIGEGVTFPSAGTYEVIEGDSFTLRAEPAPGWTFVGWTGLPAGLDSSASSLTFPIQNDLTISAVFAENDVTYGLTLETDGAGSISVTPNRRIFANGETVQLTASADPDWRFVGWRGQLPSGMDIRDITIELVMDQDRGVTAVFEHTVFLPFVVGP